jgi:XapX domain-containing protein
MKLTIVALVTGMIAGSIFTVAKLPLPAPPTVAGITGVVGIFLGAKVVEWIKAFFM